MQFGAGFAGNGGIGDIGDGHGFRAAIEGFALGGGGIRCFSRLRDDHHDGIRAGVRRAVAIFAGVFHIHGDAGQIFHHDFAREAGMTTGTAGGDDYFFEGEKRVLDGLESFAENNIAVDVLADGFANGARLLVDFAEHGIRKRARKPTPQVWIASFGINVPQGWLTPAVPLPSFK